MDGDRMPSWGETSTELHVCSAMETLCCCFDRLCANSNRHCSNTSNQDMSSILYTNAAKAEAASLLGTPGQNWCSLIQYNTIPYDTPWSTSSTMKLKMHKTCFRAVLSQHCVTMEMVLMKALTLLNELDKIEGEFMVDSVVVIGNRIRMIQGEIVKYNQR